MNIRQLSLAIMAAASALCASAQMPEENIRVYASNYYAYPPERLGTPDLTPAPEGYEPFHIEHYGRHGSRWHIGKKAYWRPVEILEIAERNDQLTPRGIELLNQLREIKEASRGRDGELTPLGAIQHRGIGRRMTQNFPEVFSDSSFVNAHSSTVVRCILSMDNELQEIAKANPRLRIVSDASESEMWYTAGYGQDEKFDSVLLDSMRQNAKRALKDFSVKHPRGKDYLTHIIKDQQFAEDSIDSNSLFFYLFNILANSQSLEHSAFPAYAPADLFTEKELVDFWTYKNADWFLRYGNSKITGNMMPHLQDHLVLNIIESADTAMVSPVNSANLRFGHEVILMPLAICLELDDFAQEINDLDSIADRWRDYEIFPMGSNIQLVFYRPIDHDPNKPILVKALLNEKERRMPGTPVSGPYYDWNQLRQYYLSKNIVAPKE